MNTNYHPSLSHFLSLTHLSLSLSIPPPSPLYKLRIEPFYLEDSTIIHGVFANQAKGHVARLKVVHG